MPAPIESKPPIEEVLRALRNYYGESVDWTGLRFIQRDDNGNEVVLSNVELVLVGELKPSTLIPRGEEADFTEYDEIRRDNTEESR